MEPPIQGCTLGKERARQSVLPGRRSPEPSGFAFHSLTSWPGGKREAENSVFIDRYGWWLGELRMQPPSPTGKSRNGTSNADSSKQKRSSAATCPGALLLF
ncbi:MAG TPA: hypothetical protein VH164_00615 [Ktedonobacteraceae bacterium]|nr:hypothetical protein [Ktedonobacteraceae bacterium]